MTESELLPATVELYRSTFKKMFAGSGFQTDAMDGIEATSLLAEHPDKMDIIITGPFSGPFLRGGPLA